MRHETSDDRLNKWEYSGLRNSMWGKYGGEGEREKREKIDGVGELSLPESRWLEKEDKRVQLDSGWVLWELQVAGE